MGLINGTIKEEKLGGRGNKRRENTVLTQRLNLYEINNMTQIF